MFSFLSRLDPPRDLQISATAILVPRTRSIFLGSVLVPTKRPRPQGIVLENTLCHACAKPRLPLTCRMWLSERSLISLYLTKNVFNVFQCSKLPLSYLKKYSVCQVEDWRLEVLFVILKILNGARAGQGQLSSIRIFHNKHTRFEVCL